MCRVCGTSWTVTSPKTRPVNAPSKRDHRSRSWASSCHYSSAQASGVRWTTSSRWRCPRSRWLHMKALRVHTSVGRRVADGLHPPRALPVKDMRREANPTPPTRRDRVAPQRYPRLRPQGAGPCCRPPCACRMLMISWVPPRYATRHPRLGEAQLGQFPLGPVGVVHLVSQNRIHGAPRDGTVVSSCALQLSSPAGAVDGGTLGSGEGLCPWWVDRPGTNPFEDERQRGNAWWVFVRGCRRRRPSSSRPSWA